MAKQASRAAWPRPASVGGVVPFLLLTAEKSLSHSSYAVNIYHLCCSGNKILQEQRGGQAFRTAPGPVSRSHSQVTSTRLT